MKIDPHHFNAEYDLIESLLNHDSPIISSSKIDSLFDEFADDYESERDILILEELLSNDSLLFLENESFHFDIPSSSRPPAKPPDGNTGILNVKMMGDIFKQKYGGNWVKLSDPKQALRGSIPGNLKTHVEGFCPPVFISSASLGNHCMRTRRSYFPPTSTIPRRSRKQTTNVVEPEFCTIVEMADNRTMAQMLQAPIKGYEDAIVVPQINANNFKLKQTLINLVQSNQFMSRQDPHNHLRFFNKVTSTFRHPKVPNTTIKLLLFPFSLEGEARIWLDKEPTRSILTWEDLVSKFINQFFPPSKTTYLPNEITNFLQKPNETFNEAWESFKDLLRQCPHHGFFELHQLDTFYNA
nr:reverse transcriptase domain-containing protein [Tanacetum cinerariifolium]